MAKRFTDTNKYKKPFFRGLQGAYKLLWDFLYHDCDHAGIWIVDFEITQSYLGKDMPVTREKAMELFNADEVRIVEIDNGKKWFLPSFIEFQYGQLSEKNRAHVNVIAVLQKHNLIDQNFHFKQNKPLASPLQGAKEQEQEKEKEMEQELEKEKPLPVTIQTKLSEALDPIFLSNTRPNWQFVDFDMELKSFREKVLADPDKYIHRDSGSFKTAFLYQLRNARPISKQLNTTTPNGTIKRTPANALIERGKTFGKL